MTQFKEGQKVEVRYGANYFFTNWRKATVIGTEQFNGQLVPIVEIEKGSRNAIFDSSNIRPVQS